MGRSCFQFHSSRGFDILVANSAPHFGLRKVLVHFFIFEHAIFILVLLNLEIFALENCIAAVCMVHALNSERVYDFLHPWIDR